MYETCPNIKENVPRRLLSALIKAITRKAHNHFFWYQIRFSSFAKRRPYVYRYTVQIRVRLYYLTANIGWYLSRFWVRNDRLHEWKQCKHYKGETHNFWKERLSQNWMIGKAMRACFKEQETEASFLTSLYRGMKGYLA
jgi:hypothetical protein